MGNPMFAAILVFAALQALAQSSGGGEPDRALIKLNLVATTNKGEPVKNGIPVTRTLPAETGFDAAKVMVFDRALHSLGSVTIKLP